MNRTLSRVAEQLYWIGRYIERAESTARLISVNANIQVDFPSKTPLGWEPLIHIVGADAEFEERYKEASEQNVVRFLACDRSYAGSIACSIARARTNARTVRDTMLRDAYQLINDLYHYAEDALTGTLSRKRRADVLGEITARIQQLDGLLSGNMSHDAGWSFLRLGNHLERADMTTRLIDVGPAELLDDEHSLSPFRDIQWRSVLRSLNALHSFRAAMGSGLETEHILRFLFADRDFPRSYHRCLTSIRNSLRALPRSERPLRVCNRMLRNLRRVDFDEPLDLHEFIDDCQIELADLHDVIGKTYFYFRPRMRRR